MNKQEAFWIQKYLVTITEELAKIGAIIRNEVNICSECGNILDHFMHEKNCSILQKEIDEIDMSHSTIL